MTRRIYENAETGDYYIDEPPTRYTPDQLGFFAEGHACELAADKASRLIADARDSGRIDGHYFSDIADPVQASEAADVIAHQVSAEYPWVGANDTASREQIYRALIGILDEILEADELEAEAAEGWRNGRAGSETSPTSTRSPARTTFGSWKAANARLVEGRDGWGILIEPLGGVSAQYWVNLGRSYYGPFDSIEAARDELRAEESATADRAADKASRQRSRDAQYLRLVAGALAHPDDAGAMADAIDPTTVETLREIAARLDGKDQA